MQLRSLWTSFGRAFSGLGYALKAERNMRIHVGAAVLVLLLAGMLRLSRMETSLLVLTIGLVFTAEVGNTALERAVDLFSPEHHRLAGLAKDVGAAAVLMAAMTSVAVGLLILGPPLWSWLTS